MLSELVSEHLKCLSFLKCNKDGLKGNMSDIVFLW